MWIRVPAGIRRQLGYRVKDMARQAEKLDASAVPPTMSLSVAWTLSLPSF